MRIGWGDEEAVDWRVASWILAPLFLNFPFWLIFSSTFLLSPLPLFVVRVAGAASIVTTIFFLGPAMAVRAAQRPLLAVIEDSIGLVPAFGMRACLFVFLIRWISVLVGLPMMWISHILLREISRVEGGVYAFVLVLFLVVTGLQSLRTGAEMGKFSTKLGFAVLISALIRVRDGLPLMIDREAGIVSSSWDGYGWKGLVELVSYAAPFAFLAVFLVRPSSNRKQVAMTGLMGIAIPLFASVILFSLIGAATPGSRFYRPSLNPSVALALWSGTAESAMPGGMMIAAMTVFGAARFSVRIIAQTVRIRVPGGPWWIGLLVAALIAWRQNFGLYQFDPIYDFLLRCFGVVSAVITADLLLRRPIGQARRFEWAGCLALLAGLAFPLFLPNRLWAMTLDFESWRHPFLLPSYAIALVVCLVGRIAGKVARSSFSLSLSCG